MKNLSYQIVIVYRATKKAKAPRHRSDSPHALSTLRHQNDYNKHYQLLRHQETN